MLINNIEIEFVYESKDCAGPYNLLFVRKDEYGISAIYANTEGCALDDTTLELRVEAGAYFKEGDILTSTKGCQFIYDGLITNGAMGSICGMTTYGDLEFDRCTLWTDVYDRDKNRNVRKAIEEEKKFLAEKIIKAEDSRKINIIKRYLSEYEHLLDEMPKHDFKPFERVLVRRTNQERWKLHLFSRESGGDNNYECECDALFDINGRGNTERLVVRNPKLRNLLKDGEYIPSLRQLNLMAHYKDSINDALKYIGAEPLSSAWFWSSTESSQYNAWYVYFFIGDTGSYSKYGSGRVRAVIDF